MNSDAMRKDIQGRGMVLKTDNSPEEFAAWLTAASIRYKKITADAKIVMQ